MGAGLFATIALAATGLIIEASPAAAAPTGCRVGAASYSKGGWGSVVCNDGRGYYRAMLYCADNVQGTVGGTYYFGPWRAIGEFAYAACSSNKWLIAVGWDLA